MSVKLLPLARLALALCLISPAASAIAVGTCQSSTATSITVSVPTDTKSDFYDIQFGNDLEARLHSLHWSNVINAPEAPDTTSAEARIWDLKPNTTYFFWVRHHSKSTYHYHGLSEGWTNFSDAWSCSTSQDASAAAPSHLVRQGKLASTAVGVSWTAPKERQFAHYKVEWCTISGPQATSCTFTNNATSSATNAQISGLAMGSKHVVRVCAVSSDGTEECGSEQMLRTSKDGHKYINMYRVTSGEVDFLSNHNTADIAAQALYMTGTEDATGAFQPFKLSDATVSESCVEMIDRPWANYLSCNTIPLPSKLFPTKRYDFCTCAAYVDRMYARVDKDWLNNKLNCISPLCKCSSKDAAYSEANVGRQPIFWPGPGYYKDKVDSPNSTYPSPQVPCGWWYSTPRKSECKRQSDMGSSCSWWQNPISRVVRAEKLTDIGWNATGFKHGGAPEAQVFHNAEVLAKAFVEMAELVSGRCCGC